MNNPAQGAPGGTLIRIDPARSEFLVPRRAFRDDAVLQAEREWILSRCWLYTGHASEVPEPGDYVSRKVAGRQVILWRDEAGRIRVFLNTCTHRGALVCREPSGNASHFVCAYHGWTFDSFGRMVEQPGEAGFPDGFFDHGAKDLHEAPRMEVYRDFVFICFDRDAVDLPTYLAGATEYLDLITPQYVADLIAWGAIGARTTESQAHRELASGISCPIGFKNGTYGNLDIAINAIKSASQSHHFLSVTKEGHSAIFTTKGNDDCHIILRGGRRPNYDEVSVTEAIEQLNDAGLAATLMVDCSHANSAKEYKNQPKVAKNPAGQIASGVNEISGVMIESHLVEGRQEADKKAPESLTYGQSITDACIGWDDTESVLRELATAVEERREMNKP